MQSNQSGLWQGNHSLLLAQSLKGPEEEDSGGGGDHTGRSGGRKQQACASRSAKSFDKVGREETALRLFSCMDIQASSAAAMVTACNTLTNQLLCTFQKRPVQQKTDAGRTSLFLSPVRVDLQLNSQCLWSTHSDTKGQYQIDRSKSKSTSTGRTGFQQAMTLSRSNTVNWQKKAGRQIGLQQYR